MTGLGAWGRGHAAARDAEPRRAPQDLSSPFFFLLEFSKTAPPRPRPCAGLRLRPCRYKRR